MTPAVWSSRADHALTEDQRKRLRRLSRLDPHTIELGVGSAGCMIATIHPASAVIAALCECSRATPSFTRAAGSPPEREALEALITETQRDVIGLVRLKLYKGNIIVVASKSLKSLYDPKSPPWRGGASAYDQSEATGFIRLNAFRLKVGAVMKSSSQEKKSPP